MNVKSCSWSGTKKYDRLLKGIMLGGLIIAGAFLYAVSFHWLADIWLNEREYSHGILVPFVSGYFVFLHRRQLASCQIRPALSAGFLLVLLAMLLLFVGRLMLVIQLEVLSFFVFLPGIIISLFGWNHLRLLLVPLGYLIFMLPVMDYVPGDIHVPLQHLAATGGAKLMHLAGYAVYQEGLLLHLPDLTIKVARECSGVNLLFSVIAVGIPLVYLYQRSLGKALLVLAGGLAVAVVANSVRVAVAGISAIHFGVNMLHGPHHVLQAFSVAVIGYFALFTFSYCINKFFPGDGPFLYEQVITRFDCGMARYDVPSNSFFYNAVSLVVFLLLAAFLLHYFSSIRAVPLTQGAKGLPHKIGAWKSVPVVQNFLESLFPDIPVRLEQSYVRGDGKRIDCFVGYFPRQDYEKHLFDYHASGLRKQLRSMRFKLPCSKLQQLKHGFASLGQGHPREIVMWYWASGRNEVDSWRARLAYARTTFTARRNNIAVILLMTDVTGTGPERQEVRTWFERFAARFECELGKFFH